MSKKVKEGTLDSGQDDRDLSESSLGRGAPRMGREGLEARVQFETLIANLSGEFINHSADKVDAEIEHAQRRVCQCLALDVSVVWQWSAESPGFLALTHLYRSLEGPPTPDPMDAQEYLPWCLRRLLDNEVIAVSSMRELPAEAARDRESWQHFGIKTSLTIPLSVGGGPLIGAVSFNDMKQERLRFEQLLSDLSAKFISQPPDQIDSVIDDSLRRLPETLGHDRSSLGQLNQETGHIQATHSCAVPGVEPFPVGVLVDDYVPWIAGQVRNGKTLLLRCLPDDLPLEAEKERQLSISKGIKSTVGIPLSVSGSVLGLMTFSFLRQPCTWPAEVVSRLQMIGEIFANALVRKRADEAIRAALAENERLRNRLEQENVYLREQVVLRHHRGRIIGQSDALDRALSEAERVAATDTGVTAMPPEKIRGFSR